MTSQQFSAQHVCEQILVEEKKYNIEHGILPSETAIADRMLERSLELSDAYEELHRKLSQHPRALRTFLGVVLKTAAHWSPTKIEEARTARGELREVNRKIAKKASELAALLRARGELQDSSGFGTDTHYHICEVIESASKHNGLFSAYLKEPLYNLGCQFDLKYWPSLSEIVDELAIDAEAAAPEARDPVTSAATEGGRGSLTDFFKALFTAIEEHSTRNFGPLPGNLRVTDNTLASLVNCALDRGPDNLLESWYVKRLRQRIREGDK